MSLKLEREIAKLEKRIKQLEDRDEETLIKVLTQAAATWMESEVEFSMSDEGKIKELING